MAPPEHACWSQSGKTPEAVATLLLLGHNPGLEDFARAACRSRFRLDGSLARRMREKFPTAALARFEFDGSNGTNCGFGSARLTHFLRPKDLTDVARRGQAYRAALTHTLLSWNGRAAIGRGRVGAGQHVDALAALMRVVRPDALRRSPRRACSPSNSFACSTTSPRTLPISTRSPSAIPSLAASSGWISIPAGPFLRSGRLRLGEARVEEAARRRGRQPERMLLVRHLDQVDMVGELRQAGRRGRRRRPCSWAACSARRLPPSPA